MMRVGTEKCTNPKCQSYKEEVLQGNWGMVVACAECGMKKAVDLKINQKKEGGEQKNAS